MDAAVIKAFHSYVVYRPAMSCILYIYIDMYTHVHVCIHSRGYVSVRISCVAVRPDSTVQSPAMQLLCKSKWKLDCLRCPAPYYALDSDLSFGRFSPRPCAGQTRLQIFPLLALLCPPQILLGSCLGFGSRGSCACCRFRRSLWFAAGTLMRSGAFAFPRGSWAKRRR